MKKKEKLTGIAWVIAGSIAGALFGGWLVELDQTRTVALFAVILCLAYLCMRVIFLVIETRRESRESRSYPANWGFDKRLE